MPKTHESHALDAYLRRIGLDHIDEASLENLNVLQASHLDALAYSNLDLLLGRPEGLNARDCLAHILKFGRSSGCYQHNGVFASVLVNLGYQVNLMWGTVGSEIGVPGFPAGNHMAVKVTIEGGDWLADVGLGDGFRKPLKLEPAAIAQHPFRYELLKDGHGNWVFSHDPRCSFAEVVIEPKHVRPEVFEPQYRYYITNPASPFLRTLAIHRRGRDFVSTLRGRTLRRIDTEGVCDVEIKTQDDLWSAIIDEFKIPINDVTADERRRLWLQMRTDRKPMEDAPPPRESEQ